MTTNKTIDGVPIATIAAFARVADAYSEAEDDSYEPWQDAIMHAELRLTLGQFRELRALLDAPASDTDCIHCCGGGRDPFGAVCGCSAPKPAAQPQGEPVAWKTGPIIWAYEADARRHGEQHEVLIVPLYAEQPAPVAVVLPERLAMIGRGLMDAPTVNHHLGWNACLDELKRLNPSL